MKYQPNDQKITMGTVLNWMPEENGPSSNDAANFCLEMGKWGYEARDIIPVDERFIEYASKNECFIEFLLKKGYIKGGLEFTIVKNNNEAIPDTISFYLRKHENGIGLNCVAPDKSHWSIVEINKNTGVLEKSSCISSTIGFSVDENGCINTMDNL